jgi:hypothetical protein
MRRKFRQLRPMAAFNPKVRAFVHDQRNDRLFVETRVGCALLRMGILPA